MKSFIAIDLGKCTGCRNCELACSVRHTSTFNPQRSRIKVIRDEQLDLIVPVVCLQCEHPLCKEACPTGALDYNESGVLNVDDSKCIGCGNCVTACIYGGIVLEPVSRKAIKCDLCNGDPACIKACEYKAISLVRSDHEGRSIRKRGIEKAIEALGMIKEAH